LFAFCFLLSSHPLCISQVVGCAALNVCDLRNNLLESVPCELGSLVTMRNLKLEGNASMAAQV
jgi:Leucine-rich repeat (LRR) protein